MGKGWQYLCRGEASVTQLRAAALSLSGTWDPKCLHSPSHLCSPCRRALGRGESTPGGAQEEPLSGPCLVPGSVSTRGATWLQGPQPAPGWLPHISKDQAKVGLARALQKELLGVSTRVLQGQRTTGRAGSQVAAWAPVAAGKCPRTSPRGRGHCGVRGRGRASFFPYQINTAAKLHQLFIAAGTRASPSSPALPVFSLKVLRYRKGAAGTTLRGPLKGG